MPFEGPPEAVAEYQKRRREIVKNVAGMSLMVVGGVGLGVGIGLGKILEQMMRVDFDASGIHTRNKDASESFKKAYDWAYGNKKAA